MGDEYNEGTPESVGERRGNAPTAPVICAGVNLLYPKLMMLSLCRLVRRAPRNLQSDWEGGSNRFFPGPLLR